MRKTILTLACLAACTLLPAQTLQTSYFSEDFTYSYRLNPAFHPRYSFVGLPFVGSSGLNYKGDFAIGDVLYSKGGETVTFMNDAVSSADFLSNFRKGLNKFSNESYNNIIAVGFKAGGMYNIVDINLRSYNSGKLPYDFMRFLKEGASTDGTYDLSGLHARSTSFADIGITSSWKLTRKLTIGMRFKAVIGLVDSYIDMDRFSISRSGGVYTISSEGVIASAYDGYEIASRQVDEYALPIIDLAHTKVGKPKELMNGFGVGADLGIIYDDSSWQFSASLSDIGCIFWFHNLYGHSPSGSRSYTGEYPAHHHSGSVLDNELSDMGALLSDAMGFTMEDEDQSLGLLPFTARFGAKYLYYSDLAFGGLATFRYDSICPFWDVRGNVEYKPSKKVELIGSLGAGSLGITIGAFANVRLGFVNVFAGTDNLIGSYGSKLIPSGKRTPNLAAGLNIIW